MKIVVTGGAGFIGANLAKHLLNIGVDEVHVLDNFSTGFRSNLSGVNVTTHEGSILDRELLDKAFDGAHSVVHLAARPSVPRSVKDPIASHDANATGTLYVLEAARKVGAHVTVASSSSVYGANPTLPKSEDLKPMPISPYAVSKLATESYALSYQAVYDLPTLAFRFFNVYGPLQAAGHAYAAVIPAFLHNIVQGKPVVVQGDGKQTRDFTFIHTVASALGQAAIEHKTADTPVNLAFGTRHSLLEVIDVMSDLVGFNVDAEHVAPRVGDVRDSQADPSRIRKLLPLVEPVGIHEGIEKTLKWHQSLPK